LRKSSSSPTETELKQNAGNTSPKELQLYEQVSFRSNGDNARSSKLA
jgi:hypothetical protein